jgi:AraC family transcriptional regulator
VVRQRVEAARRLIEQSSQFSLAEIAARTGFADQAHLTRRFREVLGVTPAAFCRQNGRRR